MSADDLREGISPLGAACSVMAAVAYGALPVLTAVAPAFTVSHPWLFALGGAAFMANLWSGLHPVLRAVAAVAQAVCVFEIVGFSIGVTYLVYAAGEGWTTLIWPWLSSWGLVWVSVVALKAAATGSRAA
jgi:hypothetical protein